MGYVAPIIGVLWRNVENTEIPANLPRTVAALAVWDGRDLPPEAAFEALARDLADARHEADRGGVFQHQSPHRGRRLGGQGQGDQAAQRMAIHHDRFPEVRLDESRRVGEVIHHPVGARRAGRPPVPAEVEGVDVPAANVGIVLSGTSTVTEHVQRLGRLLRKHGEKQATLIEVVTRGTVEEYITERRRQHDAYQG